ncbi:hypothetical protein [Streptomyces sp. NPDC059398]|uniref:hypothetical protein n=1 Tax=Streptomyces sp. NPDC059398 TaxID=3346820 RepID=UPI0036BCA5BE
MIVITTPAGKTGSELLGVLHEDTFERTPGAAGPTTFHQRCEELIRPAVQA